MISSCTSSDHGDGTICEHVCHSRYTITVIKAACAHGFECNDALGDCSHCAQHGACIIATACIYAKRSSVGLYDSMQAKDVVSSIVPCSGSSCETLQVMHCLHAGNVSCQSRSLQAIHVQAVIVHCFRWFPAYLIWPACIAAGTVEFEYQSSPIASKTCEDWCEALRAISDFQLLVFVRIMHALLQMHAGTVKHHCLQQYIVLNPEIHCPRSSPWLQ